MMFVALDRRATSACCGVCDTMIGTITARTPRPSMGGAVSTPRSVSSRPGRITSGTDLLTPLVLVEVCRYQSICLYGRRVYVATVDVICGDVRVLLGMTTESG